MGKPYTNADKLVDAWHNIVRDTLEESTYIDYRREHLRRRWLYHYGFMAGIHWMIGDDPELQNLARSLMTLLAESLVWLDYQPENWDPFWREP